MKQLSIFVLLLAGLGGLAIYALQDSTPDEWDDPVADVAEAPGEVRDRAGTEITGDAREEVESSEKEVKLTVTGRVVDRVGTPVADAAVVLASREDIRSVFRNRNSERNTGERGREGRRGRRDRGGDTGGRGGRRNRGETGRRSGDTGNRRRGRGANSVFDALKMKKMPGAVMTDADGKFELSGYAPTGGSLEVQVDHASFVHKSVRARFQKTESEVTVEDIVLMRAANVSGTVVDETGRPIAMAEVELRPQRQRGRGGLGANANPSGNSGNQGGRGRGGRFGGRGGDFSSILEMFRRGRQSGMPSVKTDDNGEFAIYRVSAGEFIAGAKADKHLPGSTERFELEEGDQRGDVRIELAIGAEMIGVVLNQNGEPVEGAEVEAAWYPPAPETSQPEAVARSTQNAADNDDNRGGRRGRRGRRGRGGQQGEPRAQAGSGLDGAFSGFGGFGGRQRLEERTKTDKDGKFVLDSLPRHEFKFEVKHKDYIEHEKKDYTVAKYPNVEVRLDSRLFLTGVVLDKHTGNPVEQYGITARVVRDRGRGGSGRRGGTEGNGRDGGRRGRGSRSGAEADPAAQAAAVARRAEAERTRVANEAYLKLRFGPTGKAPGRTPEPTRHPEGAFKLDKLMPGTYILDVHGPGYAKVAAAQVTIETDKDHPPITLELERGSLISGLVVHSRTQEPIERATVELILPPLAQASTPASTQAGRDRGRRGRGGFGSFFNREGRDRTVASTRTDKAGEFSFAQQRPGRFLIRVRVRDFPDQPEHILDLRPARDQTDIVIRARAGSRVYGKIVDLPAGERATVTFKHTDGSSEQARVDRRTMEYEIKGLKDGAYYVSVEKGSGRGRGGFGRGGFGRGGSASTPQLGNPDVVVRDGDDVRYNASIADLDFGTVKGYVTMNNAAADGFQVRLSLRTAPTNDPSAGSDNGGGRRGRRGGGGQSLSARVNSEGAFQVEKVPPGEYLLSVSSRTGRSGGRGGRRGGDAGGGGSTIHKEVIQVFAGRVTESRVAVVTGKLVMTLVKAEGEEKMPRVSVLFALAAEASDKEPSKWRGLPSYSRQRPRDGKIEVENFKIGTYAYAINGRGIKTKTGQLTVVAGGGSPVVVQLEKGDGENLGGRGGMSAIMGLLDKNKDGKLTPDELTGRFADRFKGLDKDGDGALSKEELEAFRGRGGNRGGTQGATGRGGNQGGRDRRRR